MTIGYMKARWPEHFKICLDLYSMPFWKFITHGRKYIDFKHDKTFFKVFPRRVWKSQLEAKMFVKGNQAFLFNGNCEQLKCNLQRGLSVCLIVTPLQTNKEEDSVVE